MKWADTAAEAAANNRVLAKGELGYTADNDVLKVGDGVTPWNSLPGFTAGPSGLTQEQIEDIVGAMVTGNTETNITVTYDDAAAKLNFVVSGGYTDEQAQDAVGAMFTGNTETRVAITYDDAGNKINAVVDPFPVMIPFGISGALTASAGTRRLYNPSGRTITIKKVVFSLGTVNTGSAVTLDVNINGTTIYTTQGNRPSNAASAVVSSAGTSDAAASGWDDGEYLTFDVDAVGSTIAGSDLSGMIYGEI